MTDVRSNVPSPDDAFEGAAGGVSATPTYYDRPMLKVPHWEWNVITYLFLGGIMGGLGIVAAIARDDRDDERRVRRTARFASLALAAANPAILISHLGRPERFFNMMRVIKFKSPMSLGVWGLIAYSGAAGVTTAYELFATRASRRGKREPAPVAIATSLQGLLGGFMASYTGVLISATAVPLWGAGKHHIPAISVCSGVAGACSLAALLATIEGNHDGARKLERFEMVAGVAELVVLQDFRSAAGSYGTPMFAGKRGERLRACTSIGGIAIPAALNLIGNVVRLPRSVDIARCVAASLLTLFGGYVLRDTLIEAGKESARDPRAAFRQPR